MSFFSSNIQSQVNWFFTLYPHNVWLAFTSVSTRLIPGHSPKFVWVYVCCSLQITFAPTPKKYQMISSALESCSHTYAHVTLRNWSRQGATFHRKVKVKMLETFFFYPSATFCFCSTFCGVCFLWHGCSPRMYVSSLKLLLNTTIMAKICANFFYKKAQNFNVWYQRKSHFYSDKIKTNKSDNSIFSKSTETVETRRAPNNQRLTIRLSQISQY